MKYDALLKVRVEGSMKKALLDKYGDNVSEKVRGLIEIDLGLGVCKEKVKTIVLLNENPKTVSKEVNLEKDRLQKMVDDFQKKKKG